MSFDQLIPSLVIAAVAAAVLCTLRLTLSWLGSRSTPSLFSGTLQAVAGAMNWVLLVLISLAIGASILAETPQAEHTLRVALVTLTLILLGLVCTGVPSKLAMQRLEERGNDPKMLTLYRVGSFLLGLLVWTAVGLVILDTAGADITALVASAGVGGIAVALASQSILSDILASCAIVLDEPFKIGDRLRFDAVEGTVDSIGVKTTRLSTMQGEVLVCPNAMLLNKTIRNLGGEVEDRAGQIRVPIPWHVPHAAVDQVIRATLSIQVPDTTMVQSQLGEPAEACIWLEVEFLTRSKQLESYEKARSQVLLAVLRLCSEYNVQLGRMAPWPTTINAPATVATSLTPRGPRG